MATPLRKKKKTGGDTPTEKHHSYSWTWIICTSLICITIFSIIVIWFNGLDYLINRIGKPCAWAMTGIGVLKIIESIDKLIKD
jgi:hypothetical protein